MEVGNWLLVALLALVALGIGRMLWRRRGVTTMAANEVQRRLSAKEKLVIVDVREPGEYRSGHIPGAVSVPLSNLDQAAAKLDPGAETVLVCASGIRSSAAFRRLKAKGFTRLHSMPGGMLLWRGRVDRT